jgi:3-methyladenine DNA glycosylase AlkD
VGKAVKRAQEARELGERLAALVQSGEVDGAYALSAPVLAQRTPFRLLRLVGQTVGAGQLEAVAPFLDRIADGRTEGGWVVISGALKAQLGRDLGGAFVRCREYIALAHVWYAADTLGEWVVGEALVAHFNPALELLAPWREDDDRWVRRAVGTAAHFWAKRSGGAPEHGARAEALLALLEPMLEEGEVSSVKGVGWGLKTLGRHYPQLVTEWLEEQVVRQGRRPRALMLRKALAYLSPEQRERATGGGP